VTFIFKGQYEKSLEHATRVKEMFSSKDIFEQLAQQTGIQKGSQILEKNDVRIRKCQQYLNTDLESVYKLDASCAKDSLDWKIKLSNVVSHIWSTKFYLNC
jgi:hypothetical protein